MSKNISLDEIKKFWPEKAPDINIVQKYTKKYEKEKIVIKYGGNVLIDRNIFNSFINDINILNNLGLSIIVVHGGGPRIERELKKEKGAALTLLANHYNYRMRTCPHACPRPRRINRHGSPQSAGREPGGAWFWCGVSLELGGL